MANMNRTENSPVAAELFVDPPSTDGPNQACKHSLANTEFNEFLYIYEEFIRSHFSAIKNTIKTLSIYQHDLDFVTHAKRIAIDQLHYELPANLLEDSWVAGLKKRLFFLCSTKCFTP